MMLHCTLVAAPGSALRYRTRWSWPSSCPKACPGAELQAAISRRYGTGELTVDRVPVAGLHRRRRRRSPRAPFWWTARSPAAGSTDAAPLALAVHSGPGAGLVFPLRRGRFRIGRSGTEIVIPDAELSREHAQLDVSDSAVTLLDLGSANGVRVDGKKVQRPPSPPAP